MDTPASKSVLTGCSCTDSREDSKVGAELRVSWLLCIAVGTGPVTLEQEGVRLPVLSPAGCGDVRKEVV